MSEIQRTIPASELDYQMRIVNSSWGQLEVSPDLRRTLKRTTTSKYAKGQTVRNTVTGQPEVYSKDTEVTEETSYWDLLSFYTRDFRLANITRQEKEFCANRAELAQDCMELNMPLGFFVLLGQAIPHLELSQSVGGWLRQELNKLTTEQRQQVIDTPVKRNILGMKVK